MILLQVQYNLKVEKTKRYLFLLKVSTGVNFLVTRKCPLRGHCLAPPGRRQRITLKREKNFGVGRITDEITDYGLQVTEGQTDVEFEIVF